MTKQRWASHVRDGKDPTNPGSWLWIVVCSERPCRPNQAREPIASVEAGAHRFTFEFPLIATLSSTHLLCNLTALPLSGRSRRLACLFTPRRREPCEDT